MVEIANENELKTWLEGQPREVSEAIAARAALRVVPNLVGYFEPEWEVADRSGLVLMQYRCCLVSTVASTWPTAETRGELAPAADSAFRSAAHSASGNSAALSSLSALSAAETASAYRSSSGSAVSAAYYAKKADGSSAAWDATLADAKAIEKTGDFVDLMERPVWPEGWLPDGYEARWVQLKGHLEAREGDWSFWVRFFERCFSGGSQNWEMLREVAISEKINWEAGHVGVMKAIGAIEAKYVSAATPFAEKIVLVRSGDAIEGQATPAENPNLYATALSKVRDAMSDMTIDGALAQKHAALGRVFQRLSRAISQYRGNPQRVHDDFLLAYKQVGRLVADHEIADDEDVDALQSSVLTGADDIRAADAEVRASVAARMTLRLEEGRVEDTEELSLVLRGLAVVSEGELADSLAEDAEFVLRAPVGPLPDGAPPVGSAHRDEAVDVLYRSAARTSRAYLVLMGANKIVSFGATWQGKAAFMDSLIRVVRWLIALSG